MKYLLNEKIYLPIIYIFTSQHTQVKLMLSKTHNLQNEDK